MMICSLLKPVAHVSPSRFVVVRSLRPRGHRVKKVLRDTFCGREGESSVSKKPDEVRRGYCTQVFVSAAIGPSAERRRTRDEPCTERMNRLVSSSGNVATL